MPVAWFLLGFLRKYGIDQVLHFPQREALPSCESEATAVKGASAGFIRAQQTPLVIGRGLSFLAVY